MTQLSRFHVVLIALFALAGSPLLADTYFVRQNGNDWGVNGKTPATAFASVLRAAQAVNNGDSIIIGPGTYSSSALIADRWGTKLNKLSVIGDEKGNITGDKAAPVVLISTRASDASLTFSRCKYLQINNITFHGPGQGIKLEKCVDTVIERCTFDGLSRGIAAEGTENLKIACSVLTRNTLAVFIKGSVGTSIRNLSIAGSTTSGILVLQSGSGHIVNSIFVNNNSNYVADDISAPSWYSDYNVLTGITGPWGAVPTVANVYEWPAASGQDRHSLYVMPAFVNAKEYDLHISPNISWPGGLPGMYTGDAGILEIDRDGKPMRIRNGSMNAGAYDYPDPVPAEGWKKLDFKISNEYKLQRQSAGVYKQDGVLIRTLLADTCGVRELWWDGLDDMGQPAPAGAYEIRSITHNVSLEDDGAIGDNGNPKGTYNCDNADRVVILPDGGFAITAVYDEAGFTFRRCSSSGHSVFASALVDGDFWGLSLSGEDVIGGRGKGKDCQIVKLAMPGERALMPAGVDYYLVFAEGETGTSSGLTVKDNKVYVSIAGMNIVRVIDLATGLKIIDLPVERASDIACDSQGVIWVISGNDVISLNADGKIDKRIVTGLTEANYLAAGSGKLAVNDRTRCKIAVIDTDIGKVSKTIGQDRTKDYWMPVTADTFRDPRGMAMYPDGRLVITEHGRVRIMNPDKPDNSVDMVSNFMESAVTHPLNPEYVYCGLGLYQVDEKTGAWKWVLETPTAPYFVKKEDDVWAGKRLGSPGVSVVLGGRPFIGFYNGGGKGGLKLYDVSDPLKPRLALDYDNKDKVLGGWSYDTICFTKDNSIVYGRGYTLSFSKIKFIGLDKDNNPVFDFAHPEWIGDAQETSPRKMKSINAITSDAGNGDIFFLAVTDQFKKMVPGWGADGTGVGRTGINGKPAWFSRSSGGNYMSISCVNDGKQTWVMAAKSFGGQVDLFDSDGLRVTTGNWGWPSGYSIGFVDLRFGLHAYMRKDGKPGAYTEDDAIGRFARYRLEGADSMKKTVTLFNWEKAADNAGAIPQADKSAGENPEKMQIVPKVEVLTVNGDWTQWEKAGVSPQIIGLPCNVGFKRTMADGLMQSFREGTMIGAIAHDGANFYVYFVAADDTPLFNAAAPVDLWRYDGIELWIEEEQFGLSLMKDGKPGIFKWRFHDRNGAEWKAGYGLPTENVWGQKITDLSAHKLGQRLETITGTSFSGKPGFAVMAKIPFEEVKLVGGIADREGKILPVTGKTGEIVRFAVSLNNISLRGRVQDYMIDWPAGRMYADPTRSYPFKMGN